jgi:sugar phosphate isomerase/epimerase
MGSACSTNGGDEECIWDIGGKARRRRPPGRPRHRWKDVKMDLREIGWDGVDWIELAQDRDQWRALVNTVMNPRVP